LPVRTSEALQTCSCLAPYSPSLFKVIFAYSKFGNVDVRPGYENLSYVVRIKGSGTKEQFAEVHEAVMATSPNFYNVSRPVALKPALVVE
jgi:hypothetical protein